MLRCCNEFGIRVSMGFMEAASKKRGRPPVWSPEVMGTLREVLPGLSDRQLQNRLCAVDAIQILQSYQEGDVLDVSPLLDDETTSLSVLAELGRIQDPAAFFSVTDWYLRERPKVKEAVAEIRRMRTGKSPPGIAAGLHRELVEKVNDYLVRHPDTTTDQVQHALRFTFQAPEAL